MSILPVCLQLLQSHNLHASICDIHMEKEKEAQKQNSLWQLKDEYLLI